MKLELKHLAPYLPYEFSVLWQDKVYILNTLMIDNKYCSVLRKENINTTQYDRAEWRLIKPLLLPLSELNNRFELNGEKYFPELLMIRDHLHKHLATVIITNRIQTNTLLWLDALTMAKFHFDFMGLIPAGLALNKLDYE